MKTVVVRYFCDEEESNEKFCYTVRRFCAAVAASMTTNEFSHTPPFRISQPPLGAFPLCFSCIQPSICFCSWIHCRSLSALPKNFCVEPTTLLISNACSSFNFKTHTSSSLSIEYSLFTGTEISLNRRLHPFFSSSLFSVRCSNSWLNAYYRLINWIMKISSWDEWAFSSSQPSEK